MPRRAVCLCLALVGAGFWPLSAAAVGVLSAKASVEPPRIAPGGQAEITLTAVDGFQRAIPQASVTLHTATGYFESSNQNTAVGYTDKDGVFKAIWHSNLRTEPGPQTFDASVSKNGHIGKYPITTSVKLLVEDAAAVGSPR